MFAVGLMFFIKPVAVFMLENFSGCIFYKMGFLCPACGATRCVYSIFQGNFSDAISYNIAVFAVFIYLVILLIVFNMSVLFGFRRITKILHIIIDYRVIIIISVSFALFGLVRNFI